jgi:hypothetical protein
MPGQQCERGDREDLGPAAARYQVRECGERQEVGRFVAHARDVSTQDRVLVPQRQQFRVLGDLTPQQQRGHARNIGWQRYTTVRGSPGARGDTGNRASPVFTFTSEGPRDRCGRADGAVTNEVDTVELGERGVYMARHE